MVPEGHSRQVAVVMPYHNNLYDFLNALARLGKVYVVTPRSFRKSTQLMPLVPIQKINSAPRLGPILHAYNPFKLWSMITPGTTHVMIKHLDLLENFVPALIAWAKGARIVVMVQQVKLTSPLRRAIIRGATWCIQQTGGAVFSVTASGYESLRGFFPAAAYVPACVDPQRFPLAALHHEPATELRLVSVGKYIQRKHFSNLVEAVHLIRQQHPTLPIRLTLVGPPGEQQVYNHIRQLVATTPLLREVVTLHTDVSPPSIPALLAQHHLFILPAESEPLGYSVLEAMASGLPVITTHDVGSASYVEEGKNGLILTEITPSAIAAAILSFVGSHQGIDLSKLRNYGQRSREIVEYFHTPSVIMERMKGVLL